MLLVENLNSVLPSNMLTPSTVEISLFLAFGSQPPLEISCSRISDSFNLEFSPSHVLNYVNAIATSNLYLLKNH